MDKKFHDLLVRYVNGNCTPEEVEKVNQWYQEIADNKLYLETEEQEVIRNRMLAKIHKSLAGDARSLAKHRYILPPAFLRVAAVVLLLLVSGVWLFTRTRQIADPHVNTVSVPSDTWVYENNTNASSILNLPDGSIVRLEPSSQLRFRKNFSSREREVYLTGKAFFDVVKDPSRPFYVYSNKIATQVLGTSFYVDAPANGNKVEVQVVTGKVSVFQIKPDVSEKEKTSAPKNATANGVVLSPNQKVEYYSDDDHWVTGLVEEPVPVEPVEEGTNAFVFDNTPMSSVLTDIYARFGIEVITENENILRCTFTGDVSRMTLYDMLDVISNSIGSTYEVRGTRILVSGKGCD